MQAPILVYHCYQMVIFVGGNIPKKSKYLTWNFGENKVTWLDMLGNDFLSQLLLLVTHLHLASYLGTGLGRQKFDRIVYNSIRKVLEHL